MENIQTLDLRHAPNAQWGAQGNVFRNSRFIGSDAQFHMGWAVENLYENIEVDAKQGTGSYGYGLYVQRPDVSIHGPGGGPRNVIYYSQFTSPKSGVYLGGSNEAWMFLHNRFEVKSGPGFMIYDRSFDLVMEGNVIELDSPVEAGFAFLGKQSPGVELINNTVAGRSGLLFRGFSVPEVWKGNQLLTQRRPRVARPTPAVKSIFQWQRDQ